MARDTTTKISFKPTNRRSSHLWPGRRRALDRTDRVQQGICPGGTGFRHPRVAGPHHDLPTVTRAGCISVRFVEQDPPPDGGYEFEEFGDHDADPEMLLDLVTMRADTEMALRSLTRAGSGRWGIRLGSRAC
jgi:hypothetical protein